MKLEPKWSIKMTNREMVIRLHDIARAFEDRDPAYAKEMREIADRFSELVKAAEIAVNM